MKHITAAIYYAPDGYDLKSKNIVGRVSAGNGFLRAAAHAHVDQSIFAFTHVEKFAKHFKHAVHEIEPRAHPQWVTPDNGKLLQDIGILYRPDSVLTMQAYFRMRFGISSWSICGVAHTISTHRPMEAICEYLTAPIFPWDAMICTSRAVKSTADYFLGQQADYNKWRYGAQVKHTKLQLPVIPLGVHCDDFVFSYEQKCTARTELDIPEDAVVCLFVGRLSFYEKAHPMAMYTALEAVAKTTGKTIILVECGWYANDFIKDAYEQAHRDLAPSIRRIMIDGRTKEATNTAWACADIFISLSDNIQETFGLTPVEAMAAGLPVIATDWDGYRDTVRHNVDGFLIPTIMPSAQVGVDLAMRFEAEIDGYGLYCGKAAMHVVVDQAVLQEALRALVVSPELRARLGANGKQRAREALDWAVVFRQYQGLWHELTAIRLREAANFAPSPHAHSPSKPDPFAAFSSYPSHILKGDDRIIVGECKLPYKLLAEHPMVVFAGETVPTPEACEAVMSRVANAKPSLSVVELIQMLNHPGPKVVRLLLWMMKMDYVRLHKVP